MSGRTRAVEVFTTLGGVAMLGLIAIATYIGEHVKDYDPGPWFLAAALVGIVTVAIPAVHFGLHPLVITLDARRTRILAGQAAPLAPPEPLAGPAAPASADQDQALPGVQGLLLLHAWYGSGHTWIPVTARVAQFLQDGVLAITPSNVTFQMDPTPDVVKFMIVEFELNGAVDRRTIQENTPVILGD